MKIQKESLPNQWDYVKTDGNPADLPSRGLPAQDLKESKLWWCGAEFLPYEEDNWPRSRIIKTTAVTNELRKKKSEKRDSLQKVLIRQILHYIIIIEN